MMKSRSYAAWALVEAIVLLSPIIVIFSIPVTIGCGVDVFDQCGEAPFALALCAPLAFVLLRLASPRALTRHLAVQLQTSLTHSRELNYAP
jgi:hypothetical protein